VAALRREDTVTERDGWRQRLDGVDQRLTDWMRRHGLNLDRWAIGVFFVWFGMIKTLGHKSATSIIAETVYFGDPDVTARLLGLWEVAIGVCLVIHPLARAAIALLAVRLPGTLLALALKLDVCWTDTALVPTVQGQYLIKDIVLFAAALAIGGGLSPEPRTR
jgi:uncharacterized membrane protein YkgB